MPTNEELEAGLLQVGFWNKAPREALQIVKKIANQYGGAIAIGYLDSLGYYILVSQDGPYRLVWGEKL